MDKVEYQEPEFEPIQAHKWVLVGTFLPFIAKLVQDWLERPSRRELQWMEDDVRNDPTLTEMEKENALFELDMEWRRAR